MRPGRNGAKRHSESVVMVNEFNKPSGAGSHAIQWISRKTRSRLFAQELEINRKLDGMYEKQKQGKSVLASLVRLNN